MPVAQGTPVNEFGRAGAEWQSALTGGEWKIGTANKGAESEATEKEGIIVSSADCKFATGAGTINKGAKSGGSKEVCVAEENVPETLKGGGERPDSVAIGGVWCANIEK